MERTDDESNKQPVILPPMIRIAYCTPSLHIPGGVERVLTTKANYLAENGNYDIYILLTDGKGKPPCYTLSPKVNAARKSKVDDNTAKMQSIKQLGV